MEEKWRIKILTKYPSNWSYDAFEVDVIENYRASNDTINRTVINNFYWESNYWKRRCMLEK